MLKFLCAVLAMTVCAARLAVADCCSDSPAPATAKKSNDQQQATAADKIPQTKTENKQANAESRSFSYEPAQVIEYYPRTWSSNPYAIQNDPKIIGSYGRRPASDKAIGNY
jgi:hypothetical protein